MTMNRVTVNLPATSKREIRTINVEIRDTETGPEVVLIGLSGEELDSFPVAKWFDHDESLETILDHQCPDCEESHCEDGHCLSINKYKLEEKIEEIKHAFHEMEGIIDS